MKNFTKIKNYQIHNITVPKAGIEMFKEMFPSVIYPPMILTGTVKEDVSGRWQIGNHMRSTYITVLDRQNNIIETMNSIYEINPEEEGKDVVPQMGNDVLNLFY